MPEAAGGRYHRVALMSLVLCDVTGYRGREASSAVFKTCGGEIRVSNSVSRHAHMKGRDKVSVDRCR